eukprot:s116_g23.t1
MTSHGNYYDDELDIVEDTYESYAMRRGSPSQIPVHMTQQSTKVAPSNDGKTSFFASEDAIDDWCDITELAPEKRGPALRNRLEGGAAVYKRLLDRDRLRDANEGVNYFKRTLRPHFIKGSVDLQRWMTRFQIAGNRLMESWMDLLPEMEITNPEAVAYLTARRNAHNAEQANLEGIAQAAPGAAAHVNVPWTDETALAAFNQLLNERRENQRRAFPLSANLSALIFVSLADLPQDGRNTLTSIMTHRGRTLEQYNVQEPRDLFLEIFCKTKTAVDNPMIQPSASGQRRSFLVLEEGDLDGADGYWAEDDEDGAEGFLGALEDVFWVYDDADYTWYQRRFQGRSTRRGTRKGKGKKGALVVEDKTNVMLLLNGMVRKQHFIQFMLVKVLQVSHEVRHCREQVGLQDGTSFFTYGHPEEPEKPLSLDESFEETEEPSEIGSASFYAEPSVQACENGIAFHNDNNAPPTACILILDAQEPWALEEQWKPFAIMLIHIQTVDSGMKFNQQVQDSSLQIPNNSSALRNL